MAPCSPIEARGKSIVFSLTLVGFVCVIQQCYFNSNQSFRDNEDDDKRTSNYDRKSVIQDGIAEDDNDVDADGSALNGTSTQEHRFPWEPYYKPMEDPLVTQQQQEILHLKHKILLEAPSVSAFSSSRGRSKNINGRKQSCTAELDFLATMTFANGGIRAPSCPCCV
mmetsp:Transcript_100582/g.203817  ORF Transcript_100582/g.203817 Transcript_100582/m.203817 type:complete len:167 (-) Transcript_100582:532-1032(-)